MGGGTSIPAAAKHDDLTNDEKAALMIRLKSSYQSLKEQPDEAMLAGLEKSFIDEINAARSSPKVGGTSMPPMLSIQTSELINQNFRNNSDSRLKTSFCLPISDAPLPEPSPMKPKNRQLQKANTWTAKAFPNPLKRLSNQSSKDLLSAIDEASLNQKHGIIAQRLAILQTEEIVSSPNAEFRNRRLSLAKSLQHEVENVEKTNAPIDKRTSLFSSSEIGVIQTENLPFPIDCMVLRPLLPFP